MPNAHFINRLIINHLTVLYQNFLGLTLLSATKIKIQSLSETDILYQSDKYENRYQWSQFD